MRRGEGRKYEGEKGEMKAESKEGWREEEGEAEQKRRKRSLSPGRCKSKRSLQARGGKQGLGRMWGASSFRPGATGRTGKDL